MTPVTHLAGRRIAVFGLGGSGLATAEALVAGGADVIVWDDRAAGIEAARTRNLPAADLRGIDWMGVAALVLSPGVPLTHPVPHWSVELARRHGVEVIGDIELFARERRAIAPGAPFVAITGTNGKSTTTALIAHLLAEAGRTVALGGNLGPAILSLDPPSADRVHVVECSSFQIDLAPTLDPSVGVLLNVTEDHLDRHGTFETYAALKERLVAGADTAVIAVDDHVTEGIAHRLAGTGLRVVPVSGHRPLEDGLHASAETLLRSQAGAAVPVASLAGIGSLRGEHNAQNAAAAFAAVSALGVPDAAIARGLATFPGLAHRMEEVGRLGRVLFVNDSKATNADAAAKALGAFSDIHWIAGGKPKTGGIASLEPWFGRIARAYLIGTAAEEFAGTLDGQVPHVHSGTLDHAVAQAAADAEASGAREPVVLLSPACASYDQFANFEERGRAFKALVQALLAASGDRRR